jgi:molecular chaperone DnaK (HSP70)
VDVVVTVPAYFNDSEKKATAAAVHIAGLNLLQLITEPTAAAIAYSRENIVNGKQNILVYDLGGGTFDVSIIQLNGELVTPISTDGNHSLGGLNWDRVLANHIIERFAVIKGRSEIAVRSDHKLMPKINAMTEKVKYAMTRQQRGSWDLELETDVVAREVFENMTRHLINQTLECVKSAFKAANRKNVRSIDTILLVGGATRMPQVENALRRHFGENVTIVSYKPDEIVARGAAWKAHELDSGKQKSKDISGKSYGIKITEIDTSQEYISIIIPKNSLLPVRNTKSYSPLEDNQPDILFRLFETDSIEELVELDECNEMGKAELLLPPESKCDVTLIDVDLYLDTSGRLELMANERQSGETCRLTLNIFGVIDDAEINEKKERAKRIYVGRD